MPEPVAVVAMGALTSVGLSAVETAASVRAGVCRFAASSVKDRNMEPVVVGVLADDLLPVPDPLVASFPDISERQRRLVRLAGHALLQMRDDLADKEPVTLFLALPETEVEGERADNRDLLNLLGEQTGLRLDLPSSRLYPLGRAGGVAALKDAVTILATGARRHMLVGGVDSYFSPALLEKLDQEGRISSPNNSDGFIPGEGAAFLLLSLQKNVTGPVLGWIHGLELGFEPGHRYSEQPYRGDGLATALTTLFTSSGVAEPVGCVYAGYNGENFPAKSWGVAHLRNSGRFKPDHQFEHPADCIGDTGAAMAPLMVALSVIGMTEGYRSGPSLVWCMSDRGHCGALLASAPPSPKKEG